MLNFFASIHFSTAFSAGKDIIYLCITHLLFEVEDKIEF